jgi:hypothetical protein
MYTHYQTSGSANATTCPQKENVTTTTCQELLQMLRSVNRQAHLHHCPTFFDLVTASTKRSHLT